MSICTCEDPQNTERVIDYDYQIVIAIYCLDCEAEVLG